MPCNKVGFTQDGVELPDDREVKALSGAAPVVVLCTIRFKYGPFVAALLRVGPTTCKVEQQVARLQALDARAVAPGFVVLGHFVSPQSWVRES